MGAHSITTTTSEYCFWNTADGKSVLACRWIWGLLRGPGRVQPCGTGGHFSGWADPSSCLRAETGEELALLTPPQLTLIGPIASAAMPVCGGIESRIGFIFGT